MSRPTPMLDDTHHVPEDLCPAAVKLARRVQNLSNGRVYAIILVKMGEQIFVSVEDKGKAECVK